MKKLLLAAAAICVAGCETFQPVEEKPAVTEAAQTSAVKDTALNADKHLFLEEVEGEAALSWVKAENERSLARLKADARFAELESEALAIANAKERIPYGSVRNGYVYNFWQDETNVRGLWRRTSEESYRTETPEWETILDFDALAEAEGENWVFKGANCLMPEGKRCIVTLSNGGKDAAIRREFDIESKSFVEGGFSLPEAKAGVEWVDQDTLLVATDWGEDTVTESGYPYIVKVLKRGQDMADAKELVKGQKTDVGVWPMVVELDEGRHIMGAVEADTFFTSTYWYFPDYDADPVKWPLPAKATLQGAYDGQLLVTLEQNWSPDGQDSFKLGDLVAFSADEFIASGGKLPKVELVYRPGPRQAVDGVSISKTGVFISYNDNVVGKVMTATRQESGWAFEDVDLPQNGTAGVAYTSLYDDAVFLNYEGFLSPDSLYAYNAGDRSVERIKALPDRFDASPYVVEQFEATSKDGTKVPYFLIRAKDTVLNNETPTLLYGYGGFQVSLNPSYSGYVGKMWLENGGAYILANIRGGGEFGPAWHQAGLKTKRQVVYDDFIAVAEDAIGAGLTKPERLGIMGGSNGGLLMGVMLTQRPDLFNAVVCQVPLLDMLRYHMLLAGASWVDEYGSPDVAEERAWLEQLSPYHNVDPAADYPEIFFVTSTKDDRVHPGHARKMAHRLQDLDKPFLYYENIDGGHSAAANLKEAAHRRALEYTYLMQKLMD